MHQSEPPGGVCSFLDGVNVGLTVTLQDENGNAHESVEDPRNLLHAVLPGSEDSRFPWAGSIDRYGDTTFNRVQAERLHTEWLRLAVTAADPETQALLRRIEDLLKRCASGVHLYVKFWGD